MKNLDRERENELKLTSEWSSTAWRLDVTVNATLRENVVHLTEPREPVTGALSLTAACSHTTVVLVGLPPAVSVSTAADELVLGSLTAIVGGGTDQVRSTTVSVHASIPIVEWSSSERVDGWVQVVVGAWALVGSVGVGSVVNTGGVGLEVDWSGYPDTVG